MSKRIIIVEDDVLVGLDLIEQLIECGFDAVGPFVTVADAIKDFEAHGCDVAVLDVNLGRETSEGFATVLRSQDVPFVILSGYSREQHPREFLNVASVSKPVHLPELVRILTGFIPSAA